MNAAIAAVACLLLAWVLPRHRFLTASLVACFIPLIAFVAMTMVPEKLPLWEGALALALLTAAALALARAAPQLLAALLLCASLVRLVPQLSNLALGGALTLVLLGLCGVMAWKRLDLALRLACAALGARLVLIAVPLAHAEGVSAKVWWGATTAVLLALGEVLARTRPELFEVSRTGSPPPPWPRVRMLLALAGGAVAVKVLLLGLLAPALPPPRDAASAARAAKLSAAAPQGGLVWPLPSEAITWDDPPEADFPWIDNLDARWLTGLPLHGLVRVPGAGLSSAFSLHKAVVKLRMLKDPDELEKLRFAAHATVEGVRDIVPLIKPGASEAAIAEALRAAFRKRGCEGDSFWPIVASGAAAGAPHGTGNAGTLEAGELVVLDVGCYRDHYASDFTRTFPVSGAFTAEQKKRVEGVLAAQQAARAACKPGARMSGMGDAATPSLTKIAADTLKAHGLPERYGHGLGHTVGLFVHDVEDRAPFAPGAIYTIEPGHYVEGEFGIRIEDTYLVREHDCEALTEGMPADPASIEALMARH